MVSNVKPSSFLDEDSSAADWVELFNDGQSPVSLKGLYITDDIANVAYLSAYLADPNRAGQRHFDSILILSPVDTSHHKIMALEDTIIQPGGHYLLWGGDGIINPDNHMSFKLSRDPLEDERIILFNVEGVIQENIDYLKIPEALITNFSYGRIPDGSTTWSIQITPSPGSPNGG